MCEVLSAMKKKSKNKNENKKQLDAPRILAGIKTYSRTTTMDMFFLIACSVLSYAPLPPLRSSLRQERPFDEDRLCLRFLPSLLATSTE